MYWNDEILTKNIKFHAKTSSQVKVSDPLNLCGAGWVDQREDNAKTVCNNCVITCIFGLIEIHAFMKDYLSPFLVPW